MKYILCFGNPYIQEDNLVINIADELKIPGYEIVKCESPAEILYFTSKDFIILDVAKGISKPVLITNPDQLNSKNIVSLHDFDLNYFLKLYKELGNEVKIIAIPFDYSKEKTKNFIKKQISN